MLTEPVVFEAIHGTISVARPHARAVLVTITGRDVGELGDAPLRELARHLTAASELEIFVDARAASGPSVDVSGAWASFLREHQARFDRLHMLTGSRFVELTASFVREVTGLGERMRLYKDADAFEAALRETSVGTLQP
ncbi:MAG TPA: hypothetical protein VER33_09455 [Polyangiaceae bacterium]|nr:hypothetical protein [Polyangiaceae bacterium]